MPKSEYTTKQENLTFWDSPNLPILNAIDELIKLSQAHFFVHASLLTIAGDPTLIHDSVFVEIGNGLKQPF